jgi:hypothetical protein
MADRYLGTPPAAVVTPVAAESVPILLCSRAEREARGLAALKRLLPIAGRDHGGAVRVRKFLLGLYNGQAFPFDLTDLRLLDPHIQEDCLAVLVMDVDGPSVEIHCRLPAWRSIIEQWARDAWPPVE